MPQPTIVGASVGVATNSPFYVAQPANLADNGALICIITSSYDAGAPSLPQFDVLATDTSQAESDETSPRITIGYRQVADVASEPGTYLIDASASGNTTVVLAAASDVDPDAPLALDFLFTPTGNTVNQTIPSREITEDDALWIGVWALQRYTSDEANDPNGWTVPDGVTEVGQAAGNFNFALVGAEPRDAGTVPDRTAVANASGSAGKVGSFALRGGTSSGDSGGGERVNVCTNPSPKRSLDGWAAGGFGTQETGLTVFPNTDAAVRLTPNAGQLQVRAPINDVTAGAPLTVAFEVHAEDGATVDVGASYYGVSGSVSPAQAANLAAGETRRFVFSTSSAPSGARVAAYANTRNDAQPIMVSEVLYEETETVGTWFDGDSAGATWSGTPGASTSVLGAVDLDLTDVEGATFTDSAGASAGYHRYAAHIDASRPVGLWVWFHGDGAYEYDAPGDAYCLAGDGGLIAQARARNMVLVVPQTPRPTSGTTWWGGGNGGTASRSRGTANADYARELVESMLDAYPARRTDVWLTGYSGGAQFVTQFLLPKYPTLITGGGTVVIGGGGSPIVSAPSSWPNQLRENLRMHWYTGAQDLGVNDSSGENYDGLYEAQAGAAYYASAGFESVVAEYPENLDHTMIEYQFGAVVAYCLDHPGVVSPQVAYDFESGTDYASGTWVRDGNDAHAGSYSLSSPSTSNGASSDAVFDVPSGAVACRFRYRVSTEQDGDFLRLIIGDTDWPVSSGAAPYGWVESPHYLVGDASQVTFRYAKDSNTTAGSDQVWIDDVSFEFPAQADTAALRYGWGTPHPSSDEFDNTTGSPIDPDVARWGVYGAGGSEGGDECWVGHDGNGRRCVKNAEVVPASGDEPSFLRITGQANGDTTGLAHRFDQQYGRWECRARMAAFDPSASGEKYHPVLIIWPESELWPEDGEYDWVEVDIGDPDLGAFLHLPHRAGIDNVQLYRSKTDVDLTAWHNYGFEWTADGLVGYVDGEQWFEVSGYGDTGELGDPDYSAQPVQNMPSGHLTIQLDNFDKQQVGLQPAYLDVEWARVYPPNPGGPGAFAGGNATVDEGGTFTRTAVEAGQAFSRAWQLVSGPSQVGATLSTTAQLSWTPEVPGAYLLRYTASGLDGTSTDEVRVDVAAADPATRVNLSVSPALSDQDAPAWYGPNGRLVPVTDLGDGFPRATGGDSETAGDVLTARFPVVPGERITSSLYALGDVAGTATVSIDWIGETAYIESGAKASNGRLLTIDSDRPSRLVVDEQYQQDMGDGTSETRWRGVLVPSGAVEALMKVVAPSRTLVTGHMVEREPGGVDGRASPRLATGYFDGDTEGASWIGDAGQSTSTTAATIVAPDPDVDVAVPAARAVGGAPSPARQVRTGATPAAGQGAAPSAHAGVGGSPTPAAGGGTATAPDVRLGTRVVGAAAGGGASGRPGVVARPAAAGGRAGALDPQARVAQPGEARPHPAGGRGGARGPAVEIAASSGRTGAVGAAPAPTRLLALRVAAAAAAGAATAASARTSARPVAAAGRGAAAPVSTAAVVRPGPAVGDGSANGSASVGAPVRPAAGIGGAIAGHPTATARPAAAAGRGLTAAVRTALTVVTDAAAGSGQASRAELDVQTRPRTAAGAGQTATPSTRDQLVPPPASGTGTAGHAQPRVATVPGSAPGAGRALAPARLVEVYPAAAVGSGHVEAGRAHLAVPVAAAESTGSAPTPSAAVSPRPASAGARGVVPAARVFLGVPVVPAAGHGAPDDAWADVQPRPGAAHGAGSAPTPRTGLAVEPVPAAGSGTALAPAGSSSIARTPPAAAGHGGTVPGEPGAAARDVAAAPGGGGAPEPVHVVHVRPAAAAARGGAAGPAVHLDVRAGTAAAHGAARASAKATALPGPAGGRSTVPAPQLAVAARPDAPAAAGVASAAGRTSVFPRAAACTAATGDANAWARVHAAAAAARGVAPDVRGPSSWVPPWRVRARRVDDLGARLVRASAEASSTRLVE